MRYFESKTQVYSNKKPKLYMLFSGIELHVLSPYKVIEKNGTSYGLWLGNTKPKTVNEDVLNEYYKEITKLEFVEKEITHIPVN